MIKRIFIAVLVSVSMLVSSGITELNAKSIYCEHTYQVVVVDGIKYLYEYDCDGTLVNVTVIED